jgi:hypothetical protein
VTARPQCVERRGTKGRLDAILTVLDFFRLLAMKARASHGPIGIKPDNVGLFDRVEEL